MRHRASVVLIAHLTEQGQGALEVGAPVIGAPERVLDRADVVQRGRLAALVAVLAVERQALLDRRARARGVPRYVATVPTPDSARASPFSSPSARWISRLASINGRAAA